MGLAGSLKVLSEITKFKITVLVSFTTALGYILAADSITGSMLYSIIGIFLLACSASALNHYQERNTDAMMDRTKERPIPSGRISGTSVLAISLIILFAGSMVLLFKTNLLTLCIGLLTFVWYNGIYTPLKKKSSLAIIPGSLVGALPPVAGWVAAGGNPFDARILMIALYFFVWQIPHFWLLLMIYGSDYEKGGFPTLTNIFSKEQLKRITFMWIVTTVMLAVLIPLFGIVNYTVTNLILLACSAAMIYFAYQFLRSTAERKQIIGTFIKLNFFTLALITLLSIDKIIKVL